MIYLDNAATTSIDSNQTGLIRKVIADYYNPSALYSPAQQVRKVIECTREDVAHFVGGNSENILFTPSGSASNTLAIRGWHLKHLLNGAIICSSIGHSSLIECAKSCDAEFVKVNDEGQLDLEQLRKLASVRKQSGNEVLIVISAADSEIGTIQHLMEIDNICYKNKYTLYIDFTGYIPCKQVNAGNFKTKKLMFGFSAHKLHALKGVGVLYKPKNIELEPLVYGEQEQGLVGGTENVLGILSLRDAIRNYDYSKIADIEHIQERIWLNLVSYGLGDMYLVGANIGNNRLPNNLYVCFRGVNAEALVILLDSCEILCGTGSACSSGDLKPPHTLVEIGMDKSDYHSCIRLTFNENLTVENIKYACEKIAFYVNILRKNSGD